MGITQPSISSFIAEDSNPTYDTLKRIAKATGRSLNCFLDDSTGNNNAMDSDAVSGTNNVQIGAMSSKRDTEVELLKKDNELLKKDNELLKKDIEILKLQVELLKKDKKNDMS